MKSNPTFMKSNPKWMMSFEKAVSLNMAFWDQNAVSDI